MSATNTTMASTATGTSVGGTATAAIPSLSNTYGVLMIGTFLGLILYGITLQQCYRYIHLPAYREDSTILETFHSIVSMHSLYYYLAENYFNPTVLFHGVWCASCLSSACLQGIIVAVSQSFFARRLWMIDRRFRLLAGLTVSGVFRRRAHLIQLLLSKFRQPDLVRFVEKSGWMVKAGLGVIVVADGLLTTLLTIVLRHSRTGFETTDSMLNILIVYTINTGMCYAPTLTLVCFIVAFIYPKTLLANGMNMCIAKLYAISLLAVLNSRDFLKSRRTKSSSNGAPIRSGGHPSVGVLGAGDRYNHMHGPSGSRGVIDIKLTREIVHDRRSLHSGDDLAQDEFELEKIPNRFPRGAHSVGSVDVPLPPGKCALSVARGDDRLPLRCSVSSQRVGC
ncbi:hypothetical protein BC628DRAFT_1307884 [Trametes gibbosa]|nr:hypothetical protein BC628DRAFT_1307884 [Trametes gibbosa]